MGAVVDPFARGRDPLAGGNGCGMANHGHDVTMPARPGAQNAKTILGVVVGYSLDEARQHFLGRRFRLRNHAHYPVPPSAIQRRNCAGQAMCESISDARPRQNSNAADLRRFSMAGGVDFFQDQATLRARLRSIFATDYLFPTKGPDKKPHCKPLRNQLNYALFDRFLAQRMLFRPGFRRFSITQRGRLWCPENPPTKSTTLPIAPLSRGRMNAPTHRRECPRPPLPSGEMQFQV